MFAGLSAARTFTIALLFAGAVSAACMACNRDFDSLFPTDTADDSPEPGSSGSGGSGGPDDGTSGSTPRPDETDTPLDCACSPCKTEKCTLTCPAGCKVCACEPTVCAEGVSCSVNCSPGTSCEVKCPANTTCFVTCTGIDCACTGAGCEVTCAEGDKQKQVCGDRTTCNRECK